MSKTRNFLGIIPDNKIPYRTESVHFLVLMNSTTKAL